jgi:ring-1,2-phenylacetyl-CoA epoxidase subunit PaaB
LGGEGDVRVYEVFRQERPGEPMSHSGSLLAPSDELALQYARDIFSRRNEALRLWVVAREHIGEIDDPDALKPPFDRAYRVPAGYNLVAKLRAVKARVAGEASGVAPAADADKVEAGTQA